EHVDGVVGGGQQQGIAAGVEVGGPGVIGHVGGRGVGADVDAVVVDVVADAGGVQGAQCQRGRAFGGGGESDQLREGECVGVGGDVAQDAARRDRRQLPVVTDQSHARPFGQGVADDGVQVQGAGFAGLVDDDQGAVVDAVEPGRDVASRRFGGV